MNRGTPAICACPDLDKTRERILIPTFPDLFDSRNELVIRQFQDGHAHRVQFVDRSRGGAQLFEDRFQPLLQPRHALFERFAAAGLLFGQNKAHGLAVCPNLVRDLLVAETGVGEFSDLSGFRVFLESYRHGVFCLNYTLFA
jgi:hypothetical protein